MPPIRSLSENKRVSSNNYGNEREDKNMEFLKEAGLLEAENKQLRKKLREAETELFQNEKQVNEAKFETTDLRLRLDDALSQLKDSEDEINELKRRLRLSNQNHQSSVSHPFTDLLTEVRHLIEDSNPNIQRLVDIAFKEEYAKLENIRSKIQFRDTNQIKEELGPRVETDLRNYIKSLEGRVSDLEEGISIRDHQIERLRSQLVDDRYDEREPTNSIKADFLKRELRTENLNKITAQILNEDIKEELNSERERRRDAEERVIELEHEIENLKLMAEDLKSENNIRRFREVETVGQYDNMLKNLSSNEVIKTRLAKKLDYVESKILEILQFLETIREEDDYQSIENAKLGLLRNIEEILEGIGAQQELSGSYLNEDSILLSQEKERFKILEQDYNNLKSQYYDLENRFKKYDIKSAIGSHQREELFQLQEAEHSWKIERGKLIAQIDQLQDQISQKPGVEAPSNKVISNQAERIRDLERANNRLSDDNDRLREIFDEKDNRIERLNGEVREITQLLQEEEEKNLALEKEVFTLQDENTQAEKLIELEQQLKDKNGIISEQRQKLDDSTSRSVQLTSDISKLKSTIKTYQETLLDNKKECEELHDKLQEADKQIEHLKQYRTELEQENEALLHKLEGGMESKGEDIRRLQIQLGQAEANVEQLQDLVAQYQVQLEDKNKLAHRLEKEKVELERTAHAMSKTLEDLRINIDHHVKSQTMEGEEAKIKLKELQKRHKMVMDEKKQLEDGYKEEAKKMLNLHKQAMEMLREENKELDSKFTKEMERRREEQERWRHMESKYREELDKMSRVNNTKKSKGKKGDLLDESISMSSRIEDELKKKDHEIIDLNADLDKLQRENNRIKSELNTAKIQLAEIKETSQISKRKLEEQRNKIKNLEALTSTAEKDDLQMIKELNDLREMVLEFRAERNRILSQLKDSDTVGLTIKADNDITTETMLSYIRNLVADKASLSEEIGEREAQIGDLARQIQNSKEIEKALRREVDYFKTEIANLEDKLVHEKQDLTRKIEELGRLSDKLTRREQEQGFDQKEKEIKLQQAQIERDALVSQIGGLMQEMTTMEEDIHKTLDFQENVFDILKRNFIASVGMLRTAVMGTSDQKQSDEIIKDMLAKFLSHSGMIAHKEAKLSMMEDQLKKAQSKKKTVSKELKDLKLGMNQALLTLAQKPTQKKSKPEAVAKEFASMLQTLTGAKQQVDVKKNPSLGEVLMASLNIKPEKKKSKGEVDALKGELASRNIKITRLNKEILYLSEKITELTLDNELKSKEINIINKENKSMAKTLEKAQDMYKREMDQLVQKLAGHKEINELREERDEAHSELSSLLKRVEDLELESKKKQDSIDSLRILRQSLESKLAIETERATTFEANNEKLDKKLKKLQRTADNHKEFKQRYDENKKELESLKINYEKAQQKIVISKLDLSRKDTLISQLKEKLQTNTTNQSENESQSQDDVVKKQKSEIERKATLVKTLQSKVKQLQASLSEKEDKHSEALTKLKVLMTSLFVVIADADLHLRKKEDRDLQGEGIRAAHSRIED